jgi:hypothetical protein
VSRAGYDEDGDWELLNLWRHAVDRSIDGKRGQAFLRELLVALDAMPEKRLAYYDLKSGDGVCALGCVGERRGVDLEKLDPEDWPGLSKTFGIAEAMIREIEWINDEDGPPRETDEGRWKRVRAWAARHIRPTPPAPVQQDTAP